MANGYDAEANGRDGSWAVVRRGQGPRDKAVVLLVAGLVGLVAAVALTPVVAESDGVVLSFVILLLGGISLSVAAHSFGWERARGSRLINQPRRVAVEQPYLRVGRWSIPVGEVVRLEIQQVPIAREHVGDPPHAYLVGIVLRSQVIEMLFDDPESARSVALEFVARLGVGEPVIGARPMFRGYGALLALPIILGVFAMVASGIWMLTLEARHWETALLSAGGVILANVGVFLLTWWWGGPAARSYLETEYGVPPT
jgi:hypothetical protein